MVVANAPILIIDDDPGYGASVRDLLAAYSYQANFTENSQEGLELLRQDSYHVLILDLNMKNFRYEHTGGTHGNKRRC